MALCLWISNKFSSFHLLIVRLRQLQDIFNSIRKRLRACYDILCKPGSSVGIATGYGLDGPGSNPGGGEIFRTRPDRPWGPPSLLYNAYWVYPGGKAEGAWCWLTIPLLAPRSRMSRATPLFHL
jgi:hypothetical protein